LEIVFAPPPRFHDDGFQRKAKNPGIKPGPAKDASVHPADDFDLKAIMSF
jgi:hypothetical protein